MPREFRKEGMVTARAANGDGYSAEIHRSGASALSLPYRRWHVVSWYARPTRMTRNGGGADEFRDCARGFTGVYPAGEGERIEWLDPVEAVHLHIDPETVRDPGGRPVSPLRSNPTSNAALVDTMEMVFDVLDTAELRSDVASEVARLVEEVREHLTVGLREQEASALSIGSALLSEILDMMHGEPAIAHSVSDLARRARISVAEFSRQFRSVFGTSPHDYLLVSRIEMAKNRMLRSDASLAQIAVDCGFYDQAHLSRAFKKRTGMTSREYLDHFAS